MKYERHQPSRCLGTKLQCCPPPTARRLAGMTKPNLIRNVYSCANLLIAFYDVAFVVRSPMILSVLTLQIGGGGGPCAGIRGREREGLGGYGWGVRSPGTEPTPANFKGVGRDAGNTLHNQSETIRRESEWR